MKDFKLTRRICRTHCLSWDWLRERKEEMAALWAELVAIPTEGIRRGGGQLSVLERLAGTARIAGRSEFGFGG